MRILCIGDSNTWGYIPGTGQRHERRWTKVLGQLMPRAEIIEEGYSGRTLTSPDFEQRQRCGMESLKMLLMSHKPVDCVILMLGTNDLKSRYHVSAGAIANGIREYLKIILNPYQWEGFTVPKVLALSPILLGDDLPAREGPFGIWDDNSILQSNGLAGAIAAVCAEYGVEFLDAARFARPSEVDCIHMDEENHEKLAQGIFEKLLQMPL